MTEEERKDLFLELCFIFKGANFHINVPDNGKEHIQLQIPAEFAKQQGIKQVHVGTLQYGTSKNPVERNVELRLQEKYLKKLGIHQDMFHQFNREKIEQGWLKHKFKSTEELLFAKTLADNLAKASKKHYGDEYLLIDIDRSILQLPL